VDPKPVGGVAADGGFEGTVHFADDGFEWTGGAVFVQGDFIAYFETPAGQSGAVTDDCVERTIETQREDGGGGVR